MDADPKTTPEWAAMVPRFSGGGRPTQGTVELFWNPSIQDNLTIMTTLGVRSSVLRGYQFVRGEAIVSIIPGSDRHRRSRTALVLYIHPVSRRSITTASRGSQFVAMLGGFVTEQIVGYLSEGNPDDFGIVQYWSRTRNDSLLALNETTQRSAVAAGYEWVRFEGNAEHYPWWIQENPRSYPPLPETRINWVHFLYQDVTADGDYVYLTVENGTPGNVEVVLRSSDLVTWRKEMKIVSNSGQGVAGPVAVHDTEHGPVSITLPWRDAVGRWIVLSKARAAGFMIPMGACGNLSAYTGRRINLTWVVDSGQVTSRHQLGVERFGDLLLEGDVISLTRQPGTAGQLEVELRSSARTSWWKEIKILNSYLARVDAVFTEGADIGPRRMSVAADRLTDSRLVFSKARFGGGHDDIYEVLRLQNYVGERLVFQWIRDDLPPPDRGSRGLASHWVCGVSPASEPISSNIMFDGDIITMSLAPGGAGLSADSVEFVLQTLPGVTWWKGIRLVDRLDTIVANHGTEGGGRSTPGIRVPVAELPGSSIVFSKAKGLGFHRAVYEYILTRLRCEGFAGHQVVFTWRADNLPAGTAGTCPQR